MKLLKSVAVFSIAILLTGALFFGPTIPAVNANDGQVSGIIAVADDSADEDLSAPEEDTGTIESDDAGGNATDEEGDSSESETAPDDEN